MVRRTDVVIVCLLKEDKNPPGDEGETRDEGPDCSTCLLRPQLLPQFPFPENVFKERKFT